MESQSKRRRAIKSGNPEVEKALTTESGRSIEVFVFVFLEVLYIFTGWTFTLANTSSR